MLIAAIGGTPHGKSFTSEYRIWGHMKQRCTNPRDTRFEDYGGRGIRVCQQWMDSFETFLSDVGPRPSKDFSLDRIDNDRGYEPGNVRWADRSTQQRNATRREVKLITVDGVTKSLRQWAEETGIRRGTILYRLHAGWPPERAVSRA